LQKFEDDDKDKIEKPVLLPEEEQIIQDKDRVWVRGQDPRGVAESFAANRRACSDSPGRMQMDSGGPSVAVPAAAVVAAGSISLEAGTIVGPTCPPRRQLHTSLRGADAAGESQVAGADREGHGGGLYAPGPSRAAYTADVARSLRPLMARGTQDRWYIYCPRVSP